MRPKVTITNVKNNNVIVASWMEEDVNVAKGKAKANCAIGNKATVRVGNEVVFEYKK